MLFELFSLISLSNVLVPAGELTTESVHGYDYQLLAAGNYLGQVTLMRYFAPNDNADVVVGASQALETILQGVRFSIMHQHFPVFSFENHKHSLRENTRFVLNISHFG